MKNLDTLESKNLIILIKEGFDLEELLLKRQPRIGGNAINYFYNCKTQLWYFLHNLNMEENSEYVMLGKLLQETYSEGEEKDIKFDEISLDVIKQTREIIEIKRSLEVKEAHIMQVKYYIYYLKKKYNLFNFTGKLTYPRIHKVLQINLTKDDERELERTIEKIIKIFHFENPPKAKFKKVCPKCSYFELCFS